MSGPLKCGVCGPDYTMAGKEYYRCARSRERGTCSNLVAVRVAAVEETALAALQIKLLTPDLVRLFEEEFAGEVERLSRTRDEADQAIRKRLAELEVETDALAQHLPKGAVSPTLTRMLSEREDERGGPLARFTDKPSPRSVVVAHPVLVRQYETKVARLREALNEQETRAEAAQMLPELLGPVMVHLDEKGRPFLDVQASTAALIDFAASQNAPQRVGEGRSVAVVAGTGFEPVTFRL